MTDTEKLYETLGELIYAVAKADGIIQDSERDTLKDILKDHKWASEINWSFNYEDNKEHSVEDVYDKVISVCTRIGPSPIYEEFIESMNLIAQADANLDKNESNVIHSFSNDLVARFKRDINKLYD